MLNMGFLRTVPVTKNLSYYSTSDPNRGTEPPRPCSGELPFLVCSAQVSLSGRKCLRRGDFRIH
ncbi:unnamed protein product, partial [Gulo gulo]